MNIPIVETLSAFTFLTTTGQVILPTASHFSQTDLQTPQLIAILFKPKRGSGGINGAAGSRKKEIARYVPKGRNGAPKGTQGGGSRNERPPVIALSFPQPNLQDLMAQAKQETSYRGSGRLETGGRTA